MADNAKRILQWYQQYSHDPGSKFDATTPNFLVQEKQSNVTDFILEFGRIIPEDYVDFILNCGYGRIRVSRRGERHDEPNFFMDLGDIAEILKKESGHWDIYPDFIAHDEIPFFERGDMEVLVFKKDKGSAVYSPIDDIVYAESFAEFLGNLMEDCGFHQKLNLNRGLH